MQSVMKTKCEITTYFVCDLLGTIVLREETHKHVMYTVPENLWKLVHCSKTS